MGIPLFFRYVRRTQPHILNRISLSALLSQSVDHAAAHSKKNGKKKRSEDATATEGPPPFREPSPEQGGCDHLYFDFNCAVHRCARVVDERRKARVIEETTDDLEGEVIDESCRFIIDMVRAIRPRSSVYIAVDGVPPLAKMMQQRNRRYLSKWSKSKQDAQDELWDSNCVTPGTTFMTRLNSALAQTAKMLKKDAIFKVRDVRLSDSTLPMEGEQKIMQAVRELPVEDAVCQDIVIYGLDADLLLLGSLCMNVRGTRIIRPSDQDTPPPGSHDDVYLIVDMSDFRKYIHAHIKRSDEEASVRDYIALCSLMGNDFVPGLACLPVSEESVKVIITAYHQVVPSGETLVEMTPDHLGIKRTALGNILDVLTPLEESRVRSADHDYYRQCERQMKCHNGVLDAERYPLCRPFPRDAIRPGDAGWRLRYYRHLFWNGDDLNIVGRTCSDYAEGLAWSLAYHVLGPQAVTMTWAYSNAYAPTAMDLANNIALDRNGGAHIRLPSGLHLDMLRPLFEKNKNKKTKTKVVKMTTLEKKSGFVPPVVQLLLVLPLESLKRYVAGGIVEVAASSVEGCMHLFATDFRVLTYMKRYTSDCVPFLPVFRADDIQRLCNIAFDKM